MRCACLDQGVQLLIAADQGIERFLDGNLGQPTHFGNQAAKPGDILVKGFYCMFHGQPYRPVM